jgi:hypothetical protein
MPLPFPAFELAPNLNKKNQRQTTTHNWRCFKRSAHSEAHHRQMTCCVSRQKREITCNNKEGADGIQYSKSPKEEKK